MYFFFEINRTGTSLRFSPFAISTSTVFWAAGMTLSLATFPNEEGNAD